MNRRVVQWVLVLGLIVPTGNSLSAVDDADLQQALASLLEPMDGERPGALLGLVRKGELIAAHAVGQADLSFAVPFALDTPTNIGSTGKQFTGYAIALLQERGQLSLDDDIRDYFPQLPDFGKTVTLRHLATHTSGYREFLNALALAGVRIDKGDWIEPAEAIALIQRQPALQNSPGEEWNYNNTGYVLLAQVIEQVTEMPFGDWLAQEVFAALGMDSTRVRSSPVVVLPGAARGYSKDGEDWREARDLGGAPGAGAVYTTLADMARWMGELGSFAHGGVRVGELLSEAFPNTNYGLGLMLDDWRGLRRWQHGGGDLGHLSAFYFYPDQNAGVMVFANHHELPPDLVNRLTELLLADVLPPTAAVPTDADAPFEDVLPPTAIVPADPDAPFEDAFFDAYVGRYELESVPGFVLRFFRDDGRYMTQATGQPAVEITPIDSRSFSIEVVDARIVFEPAEDGRSPALTLFQNGEHRAVRQDDGDEARPDLSELVGRYFSAELETFYELGIEDDQLTLRHRRFGPLTLHHARDESFTGSFPVATVDFVRDEQGRVSGLKAGNGRTRDVWFERVE